MGERGDGMKVFLGQEVNLTGKIAGHTKSFSGENDKYTIHFQNGEVIEVEDWELDFIAKEPKFRVKHKLLTIGFNYLNYGIVTGDWLFSSKDDNSLYRTSHTYQQLLDGGWDMSDDNLEIEEVTE